MTKPKFKVGDKVVYKNNPVSNVFEITDVEKKYWLFFYYYREPIKAHDWEVLFAYERELREKDIKKETNIGVW